MGARTALRTSPRSGQRGAPRYGLGGWSPRYLFASNEPGVWYDPSDFSTLFQNSAGTTPVTAVEQAVGLSLDKSRGLVLGPELVTNGDFSDGTTGWTITGAWAESGGQFVKTGVSTATASQAILTVGKTYRITIDVVAISSAMLLFVGLGNAQTISTTGTKTFTAVCLTDTNLYLQCVTTATATIDNISVRELAGTHRIQPGASSRPILRARYNLLTYSEQFDNAAWIKVALGTGSAPVVTANVATAPDGTTTADQIVFNRGAGNAVGDQSYIVQTPTLISATYTQYIWLKAATGGDVGKQLALRNAGGSGYGVVTLTADWVRYTRTETGSSGNWELNNRGTITADNTVTAFVWGADLRAANDTAFPYQRINAATDYDSDATKFPLYLAFDGSDDSLYTAANLDLSGTDKVTVFAGVTKLSDAALGAVAETSADSTANNGAFWLLAPYTAGVNHYSSLSRGTASAIAVSTAAADVAPDTAVLCARMNIAAPLNELRVDGAIAQAQAATQGTGNFGSYVLYMGRRNNATLPFNGREYGLIVVGAAQSAAVIQQAERWMAAKQGRTL